MLIFRRLALSRLKFTGRSTGVTLEGRSQVTDLPLIAAALEQLKEKYNALTCRTSINSTRTGDSRIAKPALATGTSKMNAVSLSLQLASVYDVDVLIELSSTTPTICSIARILRCSRIDTR
jgi:hypothetical protein